MERRKAPFGVPEIFYPRISLEVQREKYLPFLKPRKEAKKFRGSVTPLPPSPFTHIRGSAP